jgi:NADH-quinone oxidoreductase subunit A
VVAAFATLSLVASSFIRPHRPSRPKAEPYESGIEVDPVRKGQRFPVKFYIVAMLFIVFDIETIFLFVWAVALRTLGMFGLATMAIFIALLFVVEGYVWMKGGFEWERPLGPRVDAASSADRLGPDDTDPAYRRRREVARAG